MLLVQGALQDLWGRLRGTHIPHTNKTVVIASGNEVIVVRTETSRAYAMMVMTDGFLEAWIFEIADLERERERGRQKTIQETLNCNKKTFFFLNYPL